MSEESLERDEGDRLHARMLAGEPTAPSEVAQRYLEPLIAQLARRHPNLPDPHLVESAVDDALLSYLMRPDQFDPRRLSLERYLRMSAHGDLLNALRAHAARLNPQRQRVALDDALAEQEVESPLDLTVEEQAAISQSPVWGRLHELVPDAVDYTMVLLMMDGERSTEAYADALGLGALPADDKAAEVKRHKDRLRKHLRRHWPRWELDDD
jgi:RNA polymerase sigma-70 factor (ECF subfamily)